MLKKMEIGVEWDPVFAMKCCGWVVSTKLYFGRRESLIQYKHSLESESRIHHPADPRMSAPALELQRIPISLCRMAWHLQCDRMAKPHGSRR